MYMNTNSITKNRKQDISSSFLFYFVSDYWFSISSNISSPKSFGFTGIQLYWNMEYHNNGKNGITFCCVVVLIL